LIQALLITSKWLELFYRMVSTLHILLTYRCTLKCDHCDVFGSPQAKGAMSFQRVKALLKEAAIISSIRWIYYEGGEPFLVYPLLLKGIHSAKQMGFEVGVITNGSFARNNEAATQYLRPLIKLGLSRLCVSNDHYHYRDPTSSPAKRTIQIARQLNLDTIEIQVGAPNEILAETEPLFPLADFRDCATRSLMLIGRATKHLATGLPENLTNETPGCPYHDLADPKKISVEPYGYLHICQGIALGNVWDKPLSDILKHSRPVDNPVLGPIIRGGPVELGQIYHTQPVQVTNDPCWYCYQVRSSLLDRFPQVLAPRQVYGY
jgi:hypothetical protein